MSFFCPLVIFSSYYLKSLFVEFKLYKLYLGSILYSRFYSESPEQSVHGMFQVQLFLCHTKDLFQSKYSLGFSMYHMR